MHLPLGVNQLPDPLAVFWPLTLNPHGECCPAPLLHRLILGSSRSSLMSSKALASNSAEGRQETFQLVLLLLATGGTGFGASRALILQHLLLSRCEGSAEVKNSRTSSGRNRSSRF